MKLMTINHIKINLQRRANNICLKKDKDNILEQDRANYSTC